MKIQKLTPAFQDYLWGGTKLRDIYRKDCNYDKIAESWELSTHSAGESCISGGEFDGMKLSAFIEQAGEDVLGKHCAQFEKFPVLIKFIDAKEPLSVQVHPSDEYGLRVEGEYGKTEMWYVMDCDEGATLCFGVNRPVSPEEFRQRLENGTVMEVLNQVDVHKGDVFFIEAGTIHAIGAGTMICEIQQNSNTTYRVYDYGRIGADGKLRELHVEKALAVSDFNPSDVSAKQGAPVAVTGGTVQRLASCKYFTTDKYVVETAMELDVIEDSFASLMILEGSGTVSGKENQVEFTAGDSLFVPAGSGIVTVTGNCSLINTTI